ncbi:substrate-binding domain-containing protein (plasmid) [Paracoccus liaowanqingii]|uniref:Substrate-binding domain-containing protein n=1 Tax=Paracoccus liaowanqingii TaxID=2560053 RepID=A0A4Y5SS16_9RHOB|nr:substrate-binding domain-containing protein [Paracoccus liaowanqingii]QDA36290.1 substrate-binding domain-containing protein [Paracoccus liaowanqingii]
METPAEPWRKRRRPGLQAIADRVGTTKMTVSRCLRLPASVGQPLRDRILEAAREIGYLPNNAPMMLAGAPSRSIGMMVPSVTNHVFAQVLAGVVETAEAAGYRVMIAHYGYDSLAEQRGIASLIAANIDGLILGDRAHTDDALRMIDITAIPVVEVMDSRSPALQQAVGYDNFAAAQAMTRAMLAEGCRNIVYLGVRLDARTLQRFDGYAAAMIDHGLVPVSVETTEKSSFTGGSSLMQQVLADYPATDGVFCTNDDVAIGAYFECVRQEIAVPDRMAIAGFHALDIGQAMIPRLASVRTDRYGIGARAASELLDRLAGKPAAQMVIDLGYEIDLGETVGAAGKVRS